MKNWRYRVTLLWGLLSFTLVYAQEVCPTIVQEAFAAIDTYCATTERNQACYGNFALSATPQAGVTNFQFANVGDVVNAGDIATLKLEPMNTQAKTWGLVVMQLQADLPDSLPGQNVKFVLFGDVELENQTAEGQFPMQAFYMQSGIGDAPCKEAPESGLLVQTPTGPVEMTFNVNGVDVQLGSTVYFQAQRGKRMVIRTFKGSATIHTDEGSFPIIEGMEFSAPLSDDDEIVWEEIEVSGYEVEEWETFETLDEEWEDFNPSEEAWEITDPLSDEELDEFLDLYTNDEPLCSDDPTSYLPSCEDLPAYYGGDACSFDPNSDLPLCDEAELQEYWEENGEITDPDAIATEDPNGDNGDPNNGSDSNGGSDDPNGGNNDDSDTSGGSSEEPPPDDGSVPPDDGSGSNEEPPPDDGGGGSEEPPPDDGGGGGGEEPPPDDGGGGE